MTNEIQLADVTVVITVHNDSQFLPSAIESIGHQVLLPKEVIVVDDGSKDPLAKNICDQLASKFPILRIRFFQKENGGPSSARNVGLQMAEFPMIAFLDVDDTWLPENLLYKVKKLTSLSSAYFGVFGSFLSNSRNGQPKLFQQIQELQPSRDQIGVEGGFPGGAPAYLFRTRHLKEVSGFREELRLNEDYALILDLLKAGYKICGDCVPGFVRNYRNNSLTRNSNHRLLHERMKAFLALAEANVYFSQKELARRHKLNDLRLAKRMLMQGKEIRNSVRLIIHAFQNSPPDGFREFFAFAIARTVGFFI